MCVVWVYICNVCNVLCCIYVYKQVTNNLIVPYYCMFSGGQVPKEIDSDGWSALHCAVECGERCTVPVMSSC